MNDMFLTEEQKQFYRENGYLTGLPPVFAGSKAEELAEGFRRIVTLLHEDETPSDIMFWHRTSKWIYDLCRHRQILNYVEGILGPDFYLWGSEFIAKAPHSEKIVPWHQDAYYWPLSPHKTVTVWLAFTDVDEENGAMRVIPGSQRSGIIRHRIADQNAMLSFQLEGGTFREEDAVSLIIPMGGMTLHDDAIVHGSPANPSDRWRTGFVLRYSASEVKCDLEKNPNFLAYPMRGKDYGLNPIGPVPAEPFARPEISKRIRKFQ